MKDASRDSPIDAPRERLVSLDAFRGFVIASMLLVNMTWGESDWGTGAFRWLSLQLAHVPWNDPTQGATFTDLVFPWFLFIMGAAIPLSLRSGRGRSRSAGARLLQATRRGAVIYLLGVLVTMAGAWSSQPMAWTDLLRWNILQIIGAAYVCATAVSLLPRWAWWACIGAVLASKAAIMTGSDPDALRSTLAAAGLEPRGDGPAGRSTFVHFDDLKRYLNREHIDASASPWDRRVLGWFGMLQQVLPATSIALLGALAIDRLLVAGGRRVRAAMEVAGAGLVACALAWLMSAGYEANGGGLLGPLTVPMSKWLFSTPYCLLSAGTGAVVLSLCYLVVDVAGWKRLAWPWRVWGVNALALYVGAELSFKLVFSRWLMPTPSGDAASIPGAMNAWVGGLLPEGPMLAVGDSSLAWSAASGLAFAFVWLFGWYLVCAALDRRGVYIKV